MKLPNISHHRIPSWTLALIAVLCLSSLGYSQTLTPELRGQVTSLDRSDWISIADQDYLRREARANTFTASSQSSVTLAMNELGNIVVVWESRRQEGGTYGVYAQRFNRLGKRIGQEVHVNDYVRSCQWKPSVVFDMSGNAWFGWDSFGQDGDGFGCMLRCFDRNLAPLKGDTLINASTMGNQASLVMAPAGEGGLMTAWIGPDEGTYFRKAHLAPFPPRSEDSNPVRLLDDRRTQEEQIVCLAGRPDNSFVAVWSALGADRKPSGIHARLFDEDGNPLGDSIKVNERFDHGSIEPGLAVQGDDGFVVTWMQNAGASADYDVKARSFDPTGKALGPAFLVSAANGRAQSGAQVTAAHDGRFCIAWNREREAPHKSDIFARLFDEKGKELGEVFQVNGYDKGNQKLLSCSGRTSLAFGPRGQLACAWSGSSDLGDRKAAHITLLLPARERRAGDLDGDLVKDSNDLALLVDAIAGRDLDPLHYTAADLNRDGAVDDKDLACFRDGWESGHEAELAKAGKRLDARRTALEKAHEAIEKEKALARAALEEARARDPELVFKTDAAGPHEPPIRDLSMKPKDLFGGDPDPFTSRADYGFLGITNTGWTPPDPHIAVGPDHVVGMTNGAIAFFDKAGNKTFQDEIEDSYGFWGTLGATWFVFDPEVIYDPHSRRFMAMACERTDVGGGGSSYFLLAVSDDADPNGSWHKYRLNVTSQGGGGDIDSPNIAVDDDVVYLTADFFQGGQKYLIYMLKKAPLLIGSAPTITRDLLIQGTQSHGIPVVYGSASAMYLIEHFESSSNTTVRLHAINDPLGTPSLVNHTLTVPSYSPPEAPPQMGTTNKPWTFDSRFWSCVYRNGSLWAAHHQGSSRVMARWYEIDMGDWPNSGTPALVQSGDIDPGSTVRSFFNSISVDEFNNALMCFARSSPTEYISVSRAYREAGDPLGTMLHLDMAKVSNGPYTYYSRWGDYSAVGVDPRDDGTFWYMHEYSPDPNSWNTWIASKRVAPESLSIDKGTLSEATGGTITFTLNNPSHADKRYLLLGGASGTSPGTLLPPYPGGVYLPVNWDAVTDIILLNLNTALFSNFLGELDASGQATATLSVPYLPNAAGVMLHFAYCQDGSYWDFASNYVAVLIEP
ncbi:MAG: hypothetical protein ACYTG7_15280 [Planctomycetota bacterium]